MKKIVESYNEWDPLEEVMVGSLEGAMLPTWLTIAKATIPTNSEYLKQRIEERSKGKALAYDPEQIEAGQCELNELVNILEAEGVKVRRAQPYPFRNSYKTPGWQVHSGFCSANPRDVFIVIGDEIIEAPMAHRDRHYEMHAYREIIKDYFNQGARWVSAPKPELSDQLYDSEYQHPTDDEEKRYVTTEFEPTFDAADFVRCGRDIFAQRSHVTNESGIEWLRRHLGKDYRVHQVNTTCKQSAHIDTTFMPMAPGKLLYNPYFMDFKQIPEFVRKQWDIFEVPEPVVNEWQKKMPISKYVNMNFLMLDEERILVEKTQLPTIKAFKKWGFKPIPCPFSNYYPFGGSFHCATLDIRRRGELQSYFDIK